MNWFIPALVKSSVGSSPGTQRTSSGPRGGRAFRSTSGRRTEFPADASFYCKCSAQLFESLEDRFEAETLRDEAAHDAGPAFFVQFLRLLSSEASLDGAVQEGVLVHLLEYLAHGIFGGVVGNAGLPDFLQNPGAAAMLDRALHARDRERDAAVVDRPVGFQASDRRFDVVRSHSRRFSRVRICDSDSSRADNIVSASVNASEPPPAFRTNLGTSELRNSGTLFYDPNRVISGFFGGTAAG